MSKAPERVSRYSGSPCECKEPMHFGKGVVLTGGPGAGKTAVLELARRHFCEHIAVLPEAASIVFGGGFWREKSITAQKAAQRAIFFVQREMEQLAKDEKRFGVILCDRGTLDGLAYWPNSEDSFWKELGTSREQEFSRYSAVIHLRSPSSEHGYNWQNPVRIESATEAAKIDERILKAWDGHLKRYVIESSTNFLDKAARAIELIRDELPECCKHHEIPELKKEREKP